MNSFHELPKYLLEPKEIPVCIECEQCHELMWEGDSVFSYYSSVSAREVDFCTADCAIEYFDKTELTEGEVI